MRTINWQHTKSFTGTDMHIIAHVGNVVLRCHLAFSENSVCQEWFAGVHIGKIGCAIGCYGPIRKSVSKAKEDAVRLARQLLLDFQTDISAEIKNFDL